MTHTKIFKVVMLPTESASKVFKSAEGLLCHEDNYNFVSNPDVNQHLYILSDDKIIKVGDYFLCGKKISECEFSGNTDMKDVDGVYYGKDGCKKVISSTNKSLKSPLIPDSFLPRFVKAYNEGQTITEVDVEVQQLCCQTGFPCGMPCNGDCDKKCIYKIDTNSNNEIIIHGPKIYSREQMLNYCQECIVIGVKSQRNGTSFNEDFINWMDENNL